MTTVGCTADSSGDSAAPTQPRTTDTAARVRLPQGDEPVALGPGRFTTHIDNPYWPMRPGTRWTYRETDEEGTVQKVVVVVTHQTRRIANGVTARVVRDTATEDGTVVEDTRDWYAQDDVGNVWYLGEDTAEFEDGRLVTREGSFEAGVDGALAGVVVPADPAPGMHYRQEYYRGEAEDQGAVLSTHEMTEVAYGLFRDTMLTKEANPLEPRVQEDKLYAKGVGPLLALGVSGGADREELVDVDRAPRSAGTGPLGRPNP